MLEKIKELLSSKEEEITKRVETDLDVRVAEAKSEVKDYFDNMGQISQIVLPVNLVEILADGGLVQVKEIEVGSGDEVRMQFYLGRYGGNPAFDERMVLEDGCTYRMMVIVEKVKDGE